MQNVITIGRRLLPLEQIAFAEPFDPTTNPDFKSDKEFKSRVTLLNRDAVLAEIPLPEFVDAHGFRLLAEDQVAINPANDFRVEIFTPTENFRPEKPFMSRLKWRDLKDNECSKLLLTKPESVIALVLRDKPVRNGARRRPQRRSFRAQSKPTLISG
jgi:hypothetical protein